MLWLLLREFQFTCCTSYLLGSIATGSAVHMHEGGVKRKRTDAFVSYTYYVPIMHTSYIIRNDHLSRRPPRGEEDTPESRQRREARRVMGNPRLDRRLRT